MKKIFLTIAVSLALRPALGAKIAAGVYRGKG